MESTARLSTLQNTAWGHDWKLWAQMEMVSGHVLEAIRGAARNLQMVRSTVSKSTVKEGPMYSITVYESGHKIES